MTSATNAPNLPTLGSFAEGLSHSIGTPLTSVMNHLALIGRQSEREASNQPANQEVLLTIARESRGALDAVARLEQVVRGLREGFSVHPGPLEPLALDDVAHEVLDAFERLDGGRHDIVRALDHLPAVPLNRSKTQRVLLILLHNAATATPRGGQILVALRAEGRHVELSVEDQGEGVAPEHDSLIYEPFYTTRPDAVGLGLTVARAFVGVHGGTLRHDRGRDQGARFVVELPRAVA